MIDHDHTQHPQASGDEGFWRSRIGIALIVFLAVTAFLLVYEHRAHLLSGSGFLLVLLVLCVGMHFFMHGGHGGHGDERQGTN